MPVRFSFTRGELTPARMLLSEHLPSLHGEVIGGTIECGAAQEHHSSRKLFLQAPKCNVVVLSCSAACLQQC